MALAAGVIEDMAVPGGHRRSSRADASIGTSGNRLMYRAGKRYLRELGLLTTGKYTKTQLKPVADEHATSVAEVRTAVEFVEAVNQIAQVAGSRAKGQLLSGANVLMTPTFISTLSRRKPNRVKSAMRNAAMGLHPFADPIAAGESSEVGPWAYFVEQLHYAERLIDRSSAIGRPAEEWREHAIAVHRDAVAIHVVAAAGLRALGRSRVGQSRVELSDVVGTLANREDVGRTRRIVEGVVPDLALVISAGTIPTRAKETVTKLLTRIHRRATRIARATEAPYEGAGVSVSERPNGPDARPGTYVLVVHLPSDIVLRIGRLGTFWLPTGYVLYVGSAMGPGGVRRRTDRHRDADAVKRWNLDHLKGVAHPVELWWTQDTAKVVECAWAMALCGLPGFCCPAPGFGSNDCKTCPAHLYHSSARPSVGAFAEVACNVTFDHAPIFSQRLSTRARGR